MKEKIYSIAEVMRGCTIHEKVEELKKSEGKNEVKILEYNDINSYNDTLTLEDTINKELMKEKESIYIDLGKKYKQGFIQKKDIIIPMTHMDYKPKFIDWNSNEHLNYIYYSKLIVIRPNTDLVIPEYLFFKLNSKSVREYFRKNSKEGNKHRLVCKTVQDLRIEIPTIEEQNKILDKVKKVDLEKQEIREFFDKN